MSRIDGTFIALVVVQALHSLEEFHGRLYDVFPPARFMSGLVSEDRAVGFVLLNVALVTFGLWCYIWPIRRRSPSAVSLTWIWIGIELVNGVGHPLWSVRESGYTPGVATAPVLLALALYLARLMRESSKSAARTV